MEQMEQMEQILPKNSQNTRLKGLSPNYRSICSICIHPHSRSNRPSTEKAEKFSAFFTPQSLYIVRYGGNGHEPDY